MAAVLTKKGLAKRANPNCKRHQKDYFLLPKKRLQSSQNQGSELLLVQPFRQFFLRGSAPD
jgi:hypothetical protein